MKEASGELSMTAIVLVAIAVIGVLFSQLVYPQIKNQIMSGTKCSSAFNCDSNGMCEYCVDESCQQTGSIKCPKKANY